MRIAVVGLGLDGLIVAWVLRQNPRFEVVLVGDRKDEIGGDNVFDDAFTTHTKAMGNFLRAVHVPHASFTPIDGLMLRGSVVAYSKTLRKMARPDAERIVNDWRMKQGIEPGPLNGELRTRKVRKLRFDAEELSNFLVDGAEIARGAYAISPARIDIESSSLNVDYIVLCDPFWAWARRAWFAQKAPIEPAIQYVAHVHPREVGAFRAWDTVATPYTPGGAVFRVVCDGVLLRCEAGKCATAAALVSDLNFLVPSGYEITALDPQSSRVRDAPLRWPEHVVPLGRRANPARTLSLEGVVHGAYELMRRWSR